MEELAGRTDATFAFVYVREAHPGEKTPAHRSFAEKMACARRFQRTWNVQRSVLVDDIEGSVHRAFGGLPNMTYIIKRNGTIAYRADWTDAASVAAALDYLGAGGRSGAGSPSTTFYSEILGQRERHDYDAFLHSLLESAGTRAVEEFITAIAGARGKAAGDHLRRLYEDMRKSDRAGG